MCHMNNKLQYILLAGLFAFVAASCTNDKVVFSPSEVTPPVLGEYTANGDISADFTPAEFNLSFNSKMPTYHTLAIVMLDGKEVSKVVPSSVSGNTITAKNAAINKVLFSLGAQVDQTVSLELVVRASIQDATLDNGRNGYVDSKDHIVIPEFVISKVVEATIEYFDYSSWTAETDWSVIGSIASTGNGWNADEAMKSNGEWSVCPGIELSTSDQFKFRKGASWDVNIGAEGDTEPFVVELGVEYTGAANGKNLSVPEDGVYDLFVNPEKSIYKIAKQVANPYEKFTETSAWSLIGSIASTGNSWNADEAMLTDGNGWSVIRNFELTPDDQVKFRKDGGWDVNIGAEGDVEPFVVATNTQYPGAAGGKNLGVAEAGKYDILVNPDKNVYQFCVAGTVPVLE